MDEHKAVPLLLDYDCYDATLNLSCRPYPDLDIDH